MPKFTLDPETHVNEKAWYDEAMILKIWDQYIKTNKLKYFYWNDNKTSYINSLFEGEDESLLSRNAAIILNNDNSLYLRKNSNNDELCSISLCSLVCGPGIQKNISDIDPMGKKIEFDPIKDNINIALEQIKKWHCKAKGNYINKHIILFPYYLGGPHWCLGTLYINLNINPKQAELTIYDSLAQTKLIHPEIADKIRDLLSKKWNFNNTINYTQILQQYDSDSCGVIVAENGKDIIEGMDKRLKLIYPSGAKELRIQHLNEIANDVFIIRQKENISYKDPKIELLDNLVEIENKLLCILTNEHIEREDLGNYLEELSNIKINSIFDEAKAVNKLKKIILSNISIFKKEKYKINNKLLFNLLFSNDEGDYQDKAFDTLSYILRKFASRREFKKPIKSCFDAKIYHYPERIPNLIHREYLQKCIRENLTESRIAILTGFTGYGKTVLAMDYVYEHLDNMTMYDQIIWLDYQETYQIPEGESKIIKYISWDKGTRSFDKRIKYIPLEKNTKEVNYNYSYNIADIHKLLTKEVSGKTWLAVYDNVTNYSSLTQESLPPNGHIICTSRYNEWPKSVNVGPFTLSEGKRYFASIFFQSPEATAVDQYRDKYFENMLGTIDKAKRFYKAAKKLTKKLHGYPVALAVAAKKISDQGSSVEQFMERKDYRNLSNIHDIKFKEFIGLNLSKSEIEIKAKELCFICALLNHEGITENLLAELDRAVNKLKYELHENDARKLFKDALKLLINYSILNTDNSHATGYFYIPDIFKKIFLKKLYNKEIWETKYKWKLVFNRYIDIVNTRLRHHILNSECIGDEVVHLEQDIYMWVAHAKELYKQLTWRRQFSFRIINYEEIITTEKGLTFKKPNSEISAYTHEDITNIITLYIKSRMTDPSPYIIPLLSDCYLLMEDNNTKKEYLITENDGYKYAIAITAALLDSTDSREYYSKQIELEMSKIGFHRNRFFLLTNKGNELIKDNEDNNQYYVFILPILINEKEERLSIDYFFDKRQQKSSKQPCDIFDKIKHFSNDFDTKILFPYNISDNHWITGEVKIHRKNHVYKIIITSHDPYDQAVISHEDLEYLKNTLTSKIMEHNESTPSISIEIKSSPYLPRLSRNDNAPHNLRLVVDDIIKRAQGLNLNNDKYYQQNILDQFANNNLFNEHYKILIPYFVTSLKYWLIIEVRMHKCIQNGNNKIKIQMLAHDPYGKGDILKNQLHYLYYNILNNLILWLNVSKQNITHEIIESNFNPQLQKEDLASSSVIVIENLIDIIKGNVPTKSYLKGSKDIRYQHLALMQRYASVVNNDVMYSGINKSCKDFLDRHWGLGYVQSLYNDYIETQKIKAQDIKTQVCQENLKTLANIAEFIHFLGYWYSHHEMDQTKSYRCYLESKSLYFQIICSNIYNPYVNQKEMYIFNNIYNSHLKESYNFNDTNHRLMLSHYKLGEEHPIKTSLPHIIKGYHLLQRTYNYYYFEKKPIFNKNPNEVIDADQINVLNEAINFDRKESLMGALLTFYNLSTALHQAKKGFNPKSREWMKAIYKILTTLLNSRCVKHFYIDDEILKKIIDESPESNDLFKDFIENELMGRNLNFIEIEPAGGNISNLEKYLQKACESIKITKNLLNYFNNEKNSKSQNANSLKEVIKALKIIHHNKHDIKNIMRDNIKKLISKYILNYYKPLLENIDKSYKSFIECIKSSDIDPVRKNDIICFKDYFLACDEDFERSCNISGDAIKLIKITDDDINHFLNKFKDYRISDKFENKKIKIKDNFISYDNAARLCIVILVKKMRENKNILINDEYFPSHSCISLLPLFYKIIFRKLVIDFMLLLTDRNRRNLNIKLNLLNYLLYHIAESMLKSHNNLVNGLAIDRLRIKIQSQIYSLYWHFDSPEPFKIPQAMNDLISMTDNYFNKLIEYIDKTKTGDIEELFKKSGRLFYRISKIAFGHLKSISFHKNSGGSKVKSILLNIVITNLQRAFTSHNIRLLHPEHPYLNKVSKIYNDILRNYFGFTLDKIDNNNIKIANPMDIELLESKLIKFNSLLKSHQTLDSKKNYDIYCELLRTRMNRVMICFMLRRYEDGLYDCAKLCEENKAYFKAFLFRAHIYYNLEKYPEAIADFEYYLKYRPGDYNAKIWLSLARKSKELKRENIPFPHVTKKMLFVNAFTDEFLIQVKFYADIFLGTNKMLSKAEKSSRVMNALCNLIPNISIEAPVGPAPVKLTADTQPREAALAITNMYVQQAEAQKLYMASNIANYHEELKRIVHKIAETIADDLDPQINQLKDYSIVHFAQYSAKKMLDNVGRNKTNPELPIEEQLRQGLFLYKNLFSNGKCLRKEGQHFLSYWFRHIPFPIMERRWTAEGALTRVGIFSTSNHFYSRRGIHEDLTIDRKDKYGYRYGSYEEAFRLGYEKDKDKEEVALPFLKNK